MCLDESNAALRQAILEDEARQRGDDTSAKPVVQEEDNPTTPRPVNTPQGFFHRLLSGVADLAGYRGMQGKIEESDKITKGVMRGLANTANNVGRATLEFGLYLDRKTGFGELTNPGFNESYDAAGGARGFIGQNPEEAKVVPTAAMEAAYGNKTDDPLANF